MKEPVQARGRESADRVLEATLRILRTEGSEGLTIARVASESGTSNGSIFHRFGSRRVLVLSALTLFVEDLQARLQDDVVALQGVRLSLAETVEAMVEGYLSVFREQGPLIRAFVMEGLTDPGTALDAQVSKMIFVEQVSQVLGRHRARLPLEDPDTTFALVHRTIFSFCVMRLLFHDGEEFARADVQALEDAVMGMLRPARRRAR